MIPQVDLAPGYSIPRLIVGGWQLSEGHAANSPDRDSVFSLWDELLDRGADTFDCADIYTGVEALIGEYVRRRRARAQRIPQVHTKLVPDLAALAGIDRGYVTRIVDRSLGRLGLDRLDLVQFHWWDYAVPRYLEVLGWLDDLRRDGKIRLIGLTNFDSRRLRELLATGVAIASLQVQYSPLDQRPARGLDRIARANGVALLCYGTLAGGFLSERWLGTPPPDPVPNRSLVKYRLIVDDFGGWEPFQRLLEALARVAARERTSIARVAIRWVLDRPGVAAAIVGIRRREHLVALLDRWDGGLTEADRETIAAATGPSPGPAGDVYDAERLEGGPHAAIMKYDLNARAESSGHLVKQLDG